MIDARTLAAVSSAVPSTHPKPQKIALNESETRILKDINKESYT